MNAASQGFRRQALSKQATFDLGRERVRAAPAGEREGLELSPLYAEIKAVEGDALRANGNYDQGRTHDLVESIAIHAQVVGRIT